MAVEWLMSKCEAISAIEPNLLSGRATGAAKDPFSREVEEKVARSSVYQGDRSCPWVKVLTARKRAVHLKRNSCNLAGPSGLVNFKDTVWPNDYTPTSTPSVNALHLVLVNECA